MAKTGLSRVWGSWRRVGETFATRTRRSNQRSYCRWCMEGCWRWECWLKREVPDVTLAHGSQDDFPYRTEQPQTSKGRYLSVWCSSFILHLALLELKHFKPRWHPTICTWPDAPAPVLWPCSPQQIPMPGAGGTYFLCVSTPCTSIVPAEERVDGSSLTLRW